MRPLIGMGFLGSSFSVCVRPLHRDTNNGGACCCNFIEVGTPLDCSELLLYTAMYRTKHGIVHARCLLTKLAREETVGVYEYVLISLRVKKAGI